MQDADEEASCLKIKYVTLGSISLTLSMSVIYCNSHNYDSTFINCFTVTRKVKFSKASTMSTTVIYSIVNIEEKT